MDNLYVARDKSDNKLNLYQGLPIRVTCSDGTECWRSDEIGYIELEEERFPKITWEDEPLKVSLISDAVYEEMLQMILDLKSENEELKKKSSSVLNIETNNGNITII